MFKYILFDLDGTLTESGPGIINGVKYALKSIGIDEQNEDVLNSFIGPPLVESFKREYDKSKEECLALQEKYREYYNDKGVFENAPYPGVVEMLEKLKGKGFVLAIASSKPLAMVMKVLGHFDMLKYFSVLEGGEDSGKLFTKTGVIDEVLTECAVWEYHSPVNIDSEKIEKKMIEDYSRWCKEGPAKEKSEFKWEATAEEISKVKERAVMVGDRIYDIEGACANHIKAIGAGWGYAPTGELENSSAIKICKNTPELCEYLMSL